MFKNDLIDKKSIISDNNITECQVVLVRSMMLKILLSCFVEHGAERSMFPAEGAFRKVKNFIRCVFTCKFNWCRKNDAVYQ